MTILALSTLGDATQTLGVILAAVMGLEAIARWTSTKFVVQ